MWNIFRKYPRYWWLCFYLILNFIYYVLIESTGKLYAESEIIEISQATPIGGILFLLVASYVGFNFGVFEALKSIRVPKIKFRNDQGVIDKRIGLLLLFLQLLFLLYFTSTGTYVASAEVTNSTILSQIWVLMPVDVLFYVYYGCYRESKFFKWNLIVWFVSNMIRGWSGVFLTSIFFESCRLIRLGKFRIKYILVGMPLILVGYPIIYFVKLFIRFYAYKSNLTIDYFVASFNSIDLFDVIGVSIAQIFNRLQLISSSIAVFQLSPILGGEFINNQFYPFWLEGIHGLAVDKILGTQPIVNLGQALALHLDPFSNINWNSNPTFIGWFFIAPLLSVWNFSYAFTLCALIYFFVKKITSSEASSDMVWY